MEFCGESMLVAESCCCVCVQVCDLEQLVAVSRANQCSQDELAAQRAKELEQLQQELSVAQENIAELMGVARQQQAPPHPSPPQQADSVERSVYDALLQAYDNMEQYYREATRVRSEVEQQNALLVARVEQCRQEYQARSRELAELMRSKVRKEDGGGAVSHQLCGTGRRGGGVAGARGDEPHL